MKNFWDLIHEFVPCFSAFCIVDQDKTCMAVTVYNLAKGRGVTLGDSVAIPEPYLTHQTFSYAGDVSNKLYTSYRNIQRFNTMSSLWFNFKLLFRISSSNRYVSRRRWFWSSTAENSGAINKQVSKFLAIRKQIKLIKIWNASTSRSVECQSELGNFAIEIWEVQKKE